jgi:hypothetical protein
MDQTAPADRPKTDSAPALDRKAEIVLWFLLAVMGQWLFAVHTVPWCAISARRRSVRRRLAASRRSETLAVHPSARAV